MKTIYRLQRLIFGGAIILTLGITHCLQENDTEIPLGIIEVTQSSCLAANCHTTAPLAEYPPSSGRHTAHLQNIRMDEGGRACQNCHWNYNYNPLHRNGFVDGYDALNGVRRLGDSIVDFGGLFDGNRSVSGQFENADAGCSNVTCHEWGGNQLSWYAGSGCTSCHSGGSSIDPMTTNGSGTQGKHIAHFQRRGIDCEVCHQGYRNNTNHMNGVYGRIETDTIVYMADSGWPTSSSTVSMLSFNDSDGTCNQVNCHGNSSPNWYANLPNVCESCHVLGSNVEWTVGDPVPPDPTRGTYAGGNAHTSHEGANQDCTRCHYGYNNQNTHFDGNLDNASGLPVMVTFDPAINPPSLGATYTPGGSPGTGTCDNTYCHGNFNGGNNNSVAMGDTVNCTTNQCHGNAADGNPNNSSTADSKHQTHVDMLRNMNGGADYPTDASTCDVCHSGHGTGTVTHVDGTPNITFNYTSTENPSAGTTAGGAFDATNGDFDTTCSSTYCHGNFTGGAIDTVAWTESTADGGWCGSCHTTAPGSVKHTRHISEYTGKHVDIGGPGDKTYTSSDVCEICHNGYTNASTPANHVNFVKNVVFGYPTKTNTGGSPTYDNPSKTCQNVYCHGWFPRVTYDGVANTQTGQGYNPTWTASSTSPCGACHNDGSDRKSSISHGKHTAATSTYFGDDIKIESCDACHSFGTDTVRTFTADSTQGTYGTGNHANLSIDSTGVNADVAFKDGGVPTTHGADLATQEGLIVTNTHTTWNGPGATTCSNSWCHGNFTGGVVGSNATPDWLDPSTGACGTCHSSTAPSTGSHTKHVSAPYSYSCDKCHGEFTAHVNGVVGGSGVVTITFDSTNANGSWDDLLDNTNGNPGSDGQGDTCNNLYCHGNTSGGTADWADYTDGTSTANDSNNPVWWPTAGGGSGTQPCGSCHNSTTATQTSARHAIHIAGGSTNYSFPCERCHNGTVAADNTTLESGHANGALNVVPDAGNPSGAFTSGVRTCADFYCHGNFAGGLNATPDWDLVASGDCGTCHALAPDNLTYGRHNKHTNASGDATPGNGFDCSDCHSGIATSTESTAAFDTGFIANGHADFNVDISFSTRAATADGATFSGNGTVPGTGGTCADTYCHGEFSGGLNATSGNWSGGAAVCGSCHAIAPTNAQNGSHDRHTDSTAYNYSCELCHNNIATGTEATAAFDNTPTASYITNGHADFTIDVVFSGLASQYTVVTPAYSANPDADAPGFNGDCSDVYCHGAFGSGITQWLEGNTANAPAWGGSAPCGSCHGTTSGNNAGLGIPNASTDWNTSGESHVKHAGTTSTGAGYQFPCGFCHNGVYDGTLSTGDGLGATYETGVPKTTPNFGQHADGVRTPLSFYTSFTTSGTAVVNGLQDVTCSTIYCHSDGWDPTSLSYDNFDSNNTADPGITTPRWGGVSKSTMSCLSCHNRNNSASTTSPQPEHNVTGRDHFDKSSHANYSCEHCHATTFDKSGESTNNNTLIYSYSGSAQSRHVNRWKNVKWGADTSAMTYYAYKYDTGQCWVNCHKDHDPRATWYGASFPTGSKMREENTDNTRGIDRL